MACKEEATSANAQVSGKKGHLRAKYFFTGKNLKVRTLANHTQATGQWPFSETELRFSHQLGVFVLHIQRPDNLVGSVNHERKPYRRADVHVL